MDSLNENMINCKITTIKRLLRPSIFFIVFLLTAQTILAASVTVVWDRNPEPDIAGYKIYWGTSSRKYSNSATMYDSATLSFERTYKVTGLLEGQTYYFAVTAFDLLNQESDFSDEIEKTIAASNKTSDAWWDDWYETQDFLEIQTEKVTTYWKTIYFSPNRTFQNPVIIVSPPSYNEADPCVVMVRNVTSKSFRIKLKEWLYLDGRHASEDVSFIVIEAGVHVLPDGSVWQAGTYTLNGILNWKKIGYSEIFAERPMVFNTSQTYNESDTFTIRMNYSKVEGFKAAIQEEENRKYGRHVSETIGYLAIEPSGDLNLQEIMCNDHFTAVTDNPYGPKIFIEEEQSEDLETRHSKEQTGVMNINGHIFAHIQTFEDKDTAAIRIVE